MKGKICVVCGKREGKHYFGRIKIPIGKGKYIRIGWSKPFNDRPRIAVGKWTGKYIHPEYWECDRCFYGWDIILFIRDKLGLSPGRRLLDKVDG